VSAQARAALANSPLVTYFDGADKNDFLVEKPAPGALYAGTSSVLIEALLAMTAKGYRLGITMIQTGHRDDGPHGHAGGNAVDLWLRTEDGSDWEDAASDRFAQFLEDFGALPEAYQTGLVGDGADSPANFHYAAKGYESRGAFVPGVSTFQDDGGPHVHFGIKDW
jgi:hypothetical protein